MDLLKHIIHVDLNLESVSDGLTENQITPFNLSTPDGETLYCWHVLPLSLYAQHEAEILAQPPGPVSDLRETAGYKLLASDPESRLVINCTPPPPLNLLPLLPHTDKPVLAPQSTATPVTSHKAGVPTPTAPSPPSRARTS